MHADRLERAIERKGVQDRSPVVHFDAIGGEVQTMRQSHAYHRQRSQSLLLTQLHVAAGEVSAGRDRHFPRRSRRGRIDLPSVSRRNFTLGRRNDAGDFASRITNDPARCCESTAVVRLTSRRLAPPDAFKTWYHRGTNVYLCRCCFAWGFTTIFSSRNVIGNTIRFAWERWTRLEFVESESILRRHRPFPLDRSSGDRDCRLPDYLSEIDVKYVPARSKTNLQNETRARTDWRCRRLRSLYCDLSPDRVCILENYTLTNL